MARKKAQYERNTNPEWELIHEGKHYRCKDVITGRYAVTDCGRVWSYNRVMINGKNGLEYPVPPRFLKPQPIYKNGKKPVDPYFFISLHEPHVVEKPTRWHACIHRLVAEAFVANPQPKTFDEVNHKDLNKANNHYTNLEWVDHAGNMRHALDAGVMNGRTWSWSDSTKKEYAERRMRGFRKNLPRRNGQIPIHKNLKSGRVRTLWIDEDASMPDKNWKLGLPKAA